MHHMPICIYTGTEFGAADAEHILQNSLGARWTSPSIVCDAMQKRFGETIDAALAKQVKVFRNLFDVRTGRCGDAPVLRNLETLGGHRVALEPGGVLHLNQPTVDVWQNADGTWAVKAAMRDVKDLRWVRHLIRQKIPNAKIDTDLDRGLLTTTVEEPSEVVKLQLGLGGPDYHRAAVKSVFNLAAACGVQVLDASFDDVRRFVADGIDDSANFIRFAAEHSFVPATQFGPIDHFVAVVARGPVVEGFLQYYGGVQHVLRLAQNYRGTAFAFGYLVNPLRVPEPAETRAPVFDPEKVPSFDDHPLELNESTMAWMSSRLRPVLDFHVRRGIERKVTRIVDEVLAPFNGQLITAEMCDTLGKKVALAFAAHFESREALKNISL